MTRTETLRTAAHQCIRDATDWCLVLCERCGSEGRIYAALPRAHYAEPSEEDLGECGECEGTGYAFVECEPIEMEDLDEAA